MPENKVVMEYPRKSVIGNYDDYYESEEAEDKAIEEYFTKNKPLNIESIKNFKTYRDWYCDLFCDNEAVQVLINLSEEELNIADRKSTRKYS